MAGLTREEIFACPVGAPTPVDVPEWGGTVYVRMLMGDDGERVHQICKTADEGTALATWCVMCVCDSEGVPLFQNDDLEVVRKCPLPALRRCAEVALRINCITDEARKELAGNSETTSNDDGGSA
jgi:hypothetical protein